MPRYGAHTPLAVSRYGGCEPAMRSASVGGGAKNKIGRLIIGALQGNSLQGKSLQGKLLQGNSSQVGAALGIFFRPAQKLNQAHHPRHQNANSANSAATTP